MSGSDEFISAPSGVVTGVDAGIAGGVNYFDESWARKDQLLNYLDNNFITPGLR